MDLRSVAKDMGITASKFKFDGIDFLSIKAKSAEVLDEFLKVVADMLSNIGQTSEKDYLCLKPVDINYYFPNTETAVCFSPCLYDGEDLIKMSIYRKIDKVITCLDVSISHMTTISARMKATKALRNWEGCGWEILGLNDKELELLRRISHNSVVPLYLFETLGQSILGDEKVYSKLDNERDATEPYSYEGGFTKYLRHKRYSKKGTLPVKTCPEGLPYYQKITVREGIIEVNRRK